MPSRKKTRSEVLNEELNPFADTADAAFAEEQPAVEDYDAVTDERASKSSASPRLSGVKAKKDAARLRRRGPLDDSLSSGKYAAKPRSLPSEAADADDSWGGPTDGDGFDAMDADANVDDIFGMLDEDANETTGGFKDERQFQEYLETRAKERRRPKRVRKGAGDDEAEAGEDKAEERDYSQLEAGDADVMRQIDDLRRTQKLQVTAADAQAAATTSALEQEIDKGRGAVAGIAQLVALRLKLQPAVAAAVRLPQYYSMRTFADGDKASRAAAEELQETSRGLVLDSMRLCGIPLSSTSASASSERLWAKLSAKHKAMMREVDDGVNRWGHRAQMSSDPKLQAVNRPLLEQIRGVISGKQRLLHRAQRNRGHVHIFGHPRHHQKTTADRAVAIADGDADREVFDDCDFVKELAVHQGGQSAAALSSLMPEDKLKAEAKKGHHRRTKGRSVNYDVRSKLVGYMVPRPYEDANDKYEALLRSLFGGQQVNAAAGDEE